MSECDVSPHSLLCLDDSLRFTILKEPDILFKEYSADNEHDVSFNLLIITILCHVGGDWVVRGYKIWRKEGSVNLYQDP